MKSAVVAGLAVLALIGIPSVAADSGTVVRVSPKQVNFGTKAVGELYLKSATITNTSGADVLLQAGPYLSPDDFSFGLLPGETCPVLSAEILGAGDSCDIVVGFRPTEFFAGLDQTAAVAVTASDPATAAQLEQVVVEFRGVGRSPA